jgi:MFS family permease
MSFQPSETLKSRTYLGLIVAQFLAAFNDQAIHMVAIFYASDMLIRYAGKDVSESTVIAAVSFSFILPFVLFSTLAGMLADKYSKRNILVLWKVAEVLITGLALVGFLLPHLATPNTPDHKTLAVVSALLVVGAVFLMGTHSAFFIPAKYGVMPEILQSTVLSRGNGFLEATSFVANVLGTAFGAFAYGWLHSDLKGQHEIVLGHEWVIGVVLFGLALVGAVASFLIERIPAADPNRPLTWKLWQPLGRNVATMLRSRPLALAVIGIAYFSFLTFYARQTLLYQGEASKDLVEIYDKHFGIPGTAPKPDAPADGEQEKPPELPEDTRKAARLMEELGGAEPYVALLIAFIALGIGLGSPLAGTLSGNKVELGLVPIGTVFIILFTVVLAFMGLRFWGMAATLVLLGISAGFYIVPLYTLLQHRAPKDSKGNLVATSNFVNVVGGTLAILVFWLLTGILQRVQGLTLTKHDVDDHPALLNAYIDQLNAKTHLTLQLFLAASLLTMVMLLILGNQLPDFFVRTFLFLRRLLGRGILSRSSLRVLGLNNLPSDGPVILATNCERPEQCMLVLGAIDRFTRFMLVENSRDVRLPRILRWLTRHINLAYLKPGKINDQVLAETLDKAVVVLQRGEMVGLPADDPGLGLDVDRFLHELRGRINTQVIPVYCGPDQPEAGNNGQPAKPQPFYVIIGRPVPPDITAEGIRQRIHSLGVWIKKLGEDGPAPELTTGKLPDF